MNTAKKISFAARALELVTLLLYIWQLFAFLMSIVHWFTKILDAIDLMFVYERQFRDRVRSNPLWSWLAFFGMGLAYTQVPLFSALVVINYFFFILFSLLYMRVIRNNYPALEQSSGGSD